MGTNTAIHTIPVLHLKPTATAHNSIPIMVNEGVIKLTPAEYRRRSKKVRKAKKEARKASSS